MPPQPYEEQSRQNGKLEFRYRSGQEQLLATNPAVTRTHPRLAVQAFWLTFAKFISAIFGIVTPIILVRILSQQEYGVYKQVFLFTGTATNFAAFSVGVSAFYFMPRQPQRGGQIALNILVYNVAVGLIPLLALTLYPPYHHPDLSRRQLAALRADAGHFHRPAAQRVAGGDDSHRDAGRHATQPSSLWGRSSSRRVLWSLPPCSFVRFAASFWPACWRRRFRWSS